MPQDCVLKGGQRFTSHLAALKNKILQKCLWRTTNCTRVVNLCINSGISHTFKTTGFWKMCFIPD